MQKFCIASTGDSKAILIWEEAMPEVTGFGTFAALLEEQLSEKISRRIFPPVRLRPARPQ
jgi:hypothetical protein